MTHAELLQWRTHAEYLRQRATEAKAAGKWGKARLLDQEAEVVERRVQAAEVEPLRHATNDFGDCPHWCTACVAEAKERAEGQAS